MQFDIPVKFSAFYEILFDKLYANYGNKLL